MFVWSGRMNLYQKKFPTGSPTQNYVYKISSKTPLEKLMVIKCLPVGLSVMKDHGIISD